MISVIGISHRTASIEQREPFAVPAEALPALLAALKRRFGAAVLVSTCNRTEIYISRPAADAGPDELRAALIAIGAGHEVATDCVYVRDGREAAHHLLRVASGLDSMVLGEEQILGQVRSAFLAAAAADTTDRLLSRLFHLAIATGRRVRTQTSLGRYSRSVSAAAVETARRRLDGLERSTVLVLGAGEAGKLTARSLVGAGAGRLLLYNRTFERAARLASALGGVAAATADLTAALRDADVIIGASAAPDYQLTRAALRAARGAQPQRSVLVLDIAVPRDVEPAVADEPDVVLIDIDGLRSGSPDSHALPDVADAEAIVADEVEKLASWWDTLRVVPTISALREHAEGIRQAELARTFGRMRNLTPEERSRVEALTAAIVNKMLHHPIAKLKQPGSGERYAAVVHELFDLPPAASE